MSRPRSSAGYNRPKSNGGHDSEHSNNSAAANVKVAAERPNSHSAQAPDAAKQKRQIVGQYMIGKTIGEGTFGKVKLAVHIPTGEKVAIKILEKSRIKEQADVRRVNREIKILKKTRHGNIIQLYEVLDTKNTIYLIMECAEGGEMFDFIVAQKRVAEPQACKFFHQIIDGIEVLHKNEITHRDLKPENLLLKATPDGWVVKIVDFGLSNTHEGGKLLATACGSPCYAAPEMIAGKKYFGPLADIWSIGVILFALVSGYLPFEDPNTSALYKKILSGDYTTPKWISPEVKDLIDCILEVDPKRRYTVDNIRRHPWYTQIPESAIPRDVMTSTEASRTETLAAMAKAGMDTQAVLDGVASHAFNGLTAMYYLLEQKHHAKRLKKAESAKLQIRQNSSNLSKPETGSEPPSDPARRDNTSQAAQIQAQAQAPALSNIVQTGQQKGAPLKMMQIEPLAPIVAPNANVKENQEKNIPVKTFVPITPYLQAPAILQQQPQQSQQRPYHNNMPSLDMYLKSGMEMPIGAQVDSKTSNPTAGNSPFSSNLISNATPPIKPVVMASGGVAIPPLNLRAKGSNGTSAAMAAATGNSLLGNNNKAVYTSQTARGPAPQPAAPSSEAITDESAYHPYSARAALPSDIPMDIPERPNTRRSHLRSRGGGAVEPVNVGLGPGMDLDAIPPTRDTAPEMPVRRPELPSSTLASIGAVVDKSSPREGATDAATAGMSLLVISQKKSISSKDGDGSPKAAQQPAAPGATIAVAPEAPKPSSSSAAGGRRGRNISMVNSNVSASTDPAEVNVPAASQGQPAAPAVAKPISVNTAAPAPAAVGGVSAKRNPSPNSGPRVAAGVLKGGSSAVTVKPPPTRPTVQ